MENKNLDIVLEKPKSVTLSDDSIINLKPLPVMEALDFLDQVKEFRQVLTSDLIDNRDKVLSVVDMLIKRSDYKPAKGKTWREDDQISLQTLQDIIDAGLALNLPQSKTPRM